MAAPTFPSIDPTADSEGWEKEYRFRSAQFGDEYEQRVGHGNQTSRRRGTFRFTDISLTKVQQIESFLDGLGGTKPFFWTPPHETVPVLFVVDGIQGPVYAPNSGTIAMTVIQWFGAEE